MIVAVSALIITTGIQKSEIVMASAEITNWGLSFQQEGQPPIGNATAEYLAGYDSLFYQATEEKIIYLTFDAGFENGNMPKILEALKKHGVKATFFLVGNFFETEPDLVRQMVADGHTVANHTYSHPDMSAISSKENFVNELSKNEVLYKEITGQDMPKLYRPPQGKYCQSNLEMAQQLGYKTVFWSLAYVDWYQDKQPSKEEAFSKLLPRIHNGAVVLLHSTSSTNGAILDELLTKWEEAGYRFGDLENHLLGTSQAGELPENNPYSLFESAE
nr:polysaccharide deacetylase family protein [Scatolibacter rhodanostii]